MQGVSTENTLMQLLFAYKSSQVCRAEKIEFDRCRATPAGAYGDPESCEGKVSNFLQCHVDSVASKANCEV